MICNVKLTKVGRTKLSVVFTNHEFVFVNERGRLISWQICTSPWDGICFFLVFWALSFEMITFQPLITLYFWNWTDIFIQLPIRVIIQQGNNLVRKSSHLHTESNLLPLASKSFILLSRSWVRHQVCLFDTILKWYLTCHMVLLILLYGRTNLFRLSAQ